jgi:uncharacterized protein
MRYFMLMLLAVVSLNATAQKTSTVSISAIPFNLYWENTPLFFETGQNHLSVTAGAKTDMFRDPNVTYNTDNAPKLLFTPDSNFVLTVAIEHAFDTKWDGGAIVLIADSLNWVKFCFEKDYLGKHRVVSVVTKGISDDCNSVAVNANKVYYKAAKAGNVITLYYSLTGKSDWVLVRHFQLDTPRGFKVGFLAQSPEGKKCKVRFSAIRYTAKKIKDPYAGE